MSEQNSTNRRMQLFCVPFAGGSKASFVNLAKKMNGAVEVILLEYPGHESRVRESFCETMDALVGDIEAQILQKRNTKIPYALLGYSMGSIVVYELLVRLTTVGTQSMPTYIFLCANEALSNYSPRVDFAHMTEEEVTAKLVAMGGIDERIRDNPRFLKVFLRPVKADYKILCGYSFSVGRKKPKVDGSIFYSQNDTRYEQVAGWRQLLEGQLDYYEFGSDHFFIDKAYEKMADIINEKLLARM